MCENLGGPLVQKAILDSLIDFYLKEEERHGISEDGNSNFKIQR